MRFHHFLLMLCYGLCVSCSSTDPIFPREETLLQELMPLQGVTYPVRVEVKHPFLIIQNWKRTDSLFHIYDLTSYELKQAFGVKGQGPDEYVSPWLLHTTLSDFLINETKREELIYHFGINEEGVSVCKEVKQANYITDISEAAFINDSLYVIDAMYLEPSLYLLSLQDELPRKKRKYRDAAIYDYYADPNSGHVYANDNRIVFCYRYKKQIDFMDTDLNLIKRVKFKYAGPTHIKNDEKISYGLGYLGKRYLYVLFFGRTWGEYRRESPRGTIVEVYDLEGNPVVKYRLDGLGPDHFVVDEETFTLYGTSANDEPEDYLLMYKLKGLI